MPLDLGFLTITPHGDMLRITIAEQQPTTTLTAAGAARVAEYLLAWVRQKQGIVAVARVLQQSEVPEKETLL